MGVPFSYSENGTFAVSEWHFRYSGIKQLPGVCLMGKLREGIS